MTFDMMMRAFNVSKNTLLRWCKADGISLPNHQGWCSTVELEPRIICAMIDAQLRHKRGSLVCGVGLNDSCSAVSANSTRKNYCPFYAKWSSMITRCYNPIQWVKHPSYENCEVVDEWKTFSKFREWMSLQSWEGMELDKDIINPGNTLYSPANCCFVPRVINLQFREYDATGGLAGVSNHGSKFKAVLKTKYKTSAHLGVFETEIEAHKKHIEAKIDYVRALCDEYQVSPQVRSGVEKHILTWIPKSMR